MEKPKVDLILHNANVITMDRRHPLSRTVYMGKGKILKVSQRKLDKEYISPATRVIDCCKRTVIPAMHDAHCHLIAYADSLLNINIGPNEVKSIEDIVQKIRTAAEYIPAGQWIRCSGYNEYYLAEKRHPTRFDLDRATITHPVKLTHRSGHAHVLNSAGLALAGITNATEEPPGSMIERDITSFEPDGVLYGMGAFLAIAIPPLEEIEFNSAIYRAGRMLLSLGITSIQDTSTSNDLFRWNRFLYWKRKKIFTPRLSVMFGLTEQDKLQTKQPFYDRATGLSSSAIKIVLDEVSGSLNPPQPELNKLVLALHKRGFQLAIHAVEETTIEAAIIALENALNEVPAKNHRHRIEHCSVCPPHLAARLARLGAIVVTNPGFIYYSGERYLETVPPSQLQHLYAINDMLKAGIKVGAGSDAPVAPPDPFKGIYAAVTRRTENGDVVQGRQGISVMDALGLYTRSAAWSVFRESVMGSVTTGKYADLVVLNANPLSVSHTDLKRLKVDMTIMGGQVVYSEAI